LRRLTILDRDNAAWRSDLALADMIVVILRAETDHSDANLVLARNARESVGKLAEFDPGDVTCASRSEFSTFSWWVTQQVRSAAAGCRTA
jgi:hypothetical protein